MSIKARVKKLEGPIKREIVIIIERDEADAEKQIAEYCRSNRITREDAIFIVIDQNDSRAL